MPHQKITTYTTEVKYYDIDSKGRMMIKKVYYDPFLDMLNSEVISYSIARTQSVAVMFDILGCVGFDSFFRENREKASTVLHLKFLPSKRKKARICELIGHNIYFIAQVWLQTHILIQWGVGFIWFHFDLQGFHILFMVALYGKTRFMFGLF